MPISLDLALTTLQAILAYTTTVWLLSLWFRDSGIMDVFWGPGFILLTGLVYWLEPGDGLRPYLLLGLVAIWGTRLALHIGVRNHGQPEDARYAAWRSAAGDAWWWRSWFKVFLLQGVILWAVSLSLQVLVTARQPVALTPWDWIGSVLFLIGLGFEATADAQLLRFKRNPNNRGKVFDGGLWRYSRHPNYFGECLIWVGVAVWLLAVPGGALTLLGPALMIWLILRVSGVTMLDRHLTDSKPAYRDYIRRTNAFFPGPPRPQSP